MRHALLPFLALGLALLGGPAAAGEGESATAPAVPRQGESLKKFDWDALFEPGDSWKQHEQVFVWNNDTEPETLDPALMTGVTEGNVAMELFEGLTTHHPATLEPIPGVAEWWEISPDGLTYTFHLRKDARWSNGDPVTAQDFRWSWQRVLTPATRSEYTDMLYPIRDAEAFYTGKAKDFGVEAVDPLTLRVTLAAPTPYFLDVAAFHTLLPVHRATVEKHGDEWTKPENIVGNGPFVMVSRVPRESIVCVPNEKWWNRRIVRLSKMVIRAIDDQGTSFNEYLSGGVDWIRSIPARRVEEAQAHPDYYVAPYLGTYFFRFNTKRKPFDDVRVRKAFNLAIDKKSICERVLKAGQKPATGMVPPLLPWYPEFQGPGYDPKTARSLLAEAGFPEGKGFPEVEVLFNTSESHKAVCEQMADMWKTNLGVKVQLVNREWGVYLKDVQQMDYTVARGAWIGDYNDQHSFLDMWVEGRGNNNTGWANPRYKELIERGVRELDPAKRTQLYRDAEQILCGEDLPILPLYYYVNQGMLRPRVKGFHETIRDLHPCQYIYLDGPPAKSAGK